VTIGVLSVYLSRPLRVYRKRIYLLVRVGIEMKMNEKQKCSSLFLIGFTRVISLYQSPFHHHLNAITMNSLFLAPAVTAS